MRSVVIILAGCALGLALSQCGDEAAVGPLEITAVSPLANAPAATALERGRHVVLLFSPSECSAALRAVERLNEIAADDGSPIASAGIVNTPYVQAAHKVIQAYEMEFPVYSDPSGRIRARFGARLKPSLLRVEDGRVVRVVEIGAAGSAEYEALFRD